MLSQSQQAYLTLAARTMKIIVVAMLFGVAFFFGIALFIGGGKGNQGPPDDPFLAYLAAGVALAALVAWAVVPALVTGQMRRSVVNGAASKMPLNLPADEEVGDVGPLVAIFQTRLIVGVALLEGAAFFNLIAYMLEGQVLSLAATGVLLVAMLCQMPSRTRLEGWVDNELTAVEQLRQMRTFDA